MNNFPRPFVSGIKEAAMRMGRLFIEKVRDIVGLYMNPPDKALVLCVDEKTQIESLKGKTRCRQVKFYSGVCALASRWFCLSRILQAGPEPIRF
jgi:hypothetical protein